MRRIRFFYVQEAINTLEKHNFCNCQILDAILCFNLRQFIFFVQRTVSYRHYLWTVTFQIMFGPILWPHLMLLAYTENKLCKCHCHMLKLSTAFIYQTQTAVQTVWSLFSQDCLKVLCFITTATVCLAHYVSVESLSGSVRLYSHLVVLLLCVKQTEHCPRGAVWRSFSQQTCHQWYKLILIIRAFFSIPRWERRHFCSNNVWHTWNTNKTNKNNKQ